MLLTKFRVSWLFGSEERKKKILAIFDLHVTLMLTMKFRVNWPFGLGEAAKNRFLRWPPSWISRNDFSYF